MKRKPWGFAIDDALEGIFDAVDWIYWSLAQQNPREFVWIDTNLEMHEAMQFFGTTMLNNSYEPIKT